MSKNLKVIQVVAKIAYVISYIVFVCSIIGAAACALMLIMSPAMFLLNSPQINELMNLTGLEILTLCRECGVAAFACVGGIITGFMAKKYFKYQCDVGTPFTYEGSNMLLRLGVAVLIVELSVNIFESITIAVYELLKISNYAGEISEGQDFSLSLLFIVLSFVFKYGAELAETKKAEINTSVSAVDENNVNNGTDVENK